MKNKNSLIVGAVIIAILVIGSFIIAGNNNRQQTGINQEVATQPSSRFLSYSEENLKKATENNGRAIIFFHASWCPLCVAAERDLKSNFDKVPKDITILKTDYDTSQQLKSKYGIVAQDTWVQVDAEGKEIAKWNSGGQGLSALLANLK